MTATLSRNVATSHHNSIATKAKGTVQPPAISGQLLADLRASVNMPFYTERNGERKVVYLVEVGKKVKLKRSLDAVDSFSEPLERFVRYYKPC